MNDGEEVTEDFEMAVAMESFWVLGLGFVEVSAGHSCSRTHFGWRSRLLPDIPAG